MLADPYAIDLVANTMYALVLNREVSLKHIDFPGAELPMLSQ
jgi:hypothetical protein